MKPLTLARRGLRIAWLLAGMIAAPATLTTPHAADPTAYIVRIAPTGDGALDEALSGASTLKSLRESAPVGPFALIARAEQDAGRFRAALDSFGYYEGAVTVLIGGRRLDDPGLLDMLDRAPPAPPVTVTVTLSRGRLFHIGAVRLEGSVPPSARDTLGLRQGAPALAAEVLAARTRLLGALRDQGYALATVEEPIATLRPEQALLDVSFTVATGPRVAIGPITISGLDRMHDSFVRQRLLIRQGQLFSASEIEKARQDLAGLGVFAAVRTVPAPTLDADGQLPIAFDVTERKRRAVTFGAFYSTDLGAGLNAGWSHRNLFGNAEQLNLTAGLQGGGTALRAPGYNANIQFIKPDFRARDQQLQIDLGAVKQSLDAYDQTAVTADILINRKFGSHWTGSIGLAGEIARITQEGTTHDYTLLGIPITARYDSTDSLFAPTRGIRALISLTPTESFRNPPATFVLMQAQGSTYVDLTRFGLTDPGRSVLAFRGLIASAQGASQFDLPPDKRFYAGGSATIRGYRFQSVGPQFPVTNNPQGGTSLVAGSAELRQRIVGNYGMAVFLDAGQVAADSAPFTGVWRVGAGLGARYYTSIGPIRLDLAVPLVKQTGSDALEVYIGIGEAF